jgi:hypothetical protein
MHDGAGDAEAGSQGDCPPRERRPRGCAPLEQTSGTLTLSVTDARNGDFFELPVEREQALAAFHHPFAFAAARGVDYRTAARDPGDTVYA